MQNEIIGDYPHIQASYIHIHQRNVVSVIESKFSILPVPTFYIRHNRKQEKSKLNNGLN